jgi:steroid delta-isomerase-like uncharacterized protein
VWNGHRPDLIEQYRAEDCVHHDAPGLTHRESIQNFFSTFQNSFPDFTVSIEAQIAEGELVVVRETFSGTQQGEWMGLPASGKQFSARGVYIFRVADGKIADLWGLADSLGIMQQLGAIPTSETV